MKRPAIPPLKPYPEATQQAIEALNTRLLEEPTGRRAWLAWHHSHPHPHPSN